MPSIKDSSMFNGTRAKILQPKVESWHNGKIFKFHSSYYKGWLPLSLKSTRNIGIWILVDHNLVSWLQKKIKCTN